MKPKCNQQITQGTKSLIKAYNFSIKKFLFLGGPWPV